MLKQGTIIRCKDEEEMLDFLHMVHNHGGECMCTDFNHRLMEITREMTDDPYKLEREDIE